MVFILNIPLFILSLLKLNKKFTLYSFIGTFVFSMFLVLTRPMSNIVNINDTLLYCLYGGVVCGLGIGIVFIHNGSTGEFDIIAMLVKKKHPDFDLGKIYFFTNIGIVIIGSFIFSLSNGLYTIISMYTTSFVIDSLIKRTSQGNVKRVTSEQSEQTTLATKSVISQ